MSKLPKEKREKLILVCIAITGVLGLLYTFVLGPQRDRIAAVQIQILSVEDKLSKAERLVRNAGIIQEELVGWRAELATRQVDMAPQGQYYIWFFKLLENFCQEERLGNNFILDVTQPEFAPVGLIPNFPYSAGHFGVRVSGGFHDIGRFFAQFENKYPYMRINGVKLLPQPKYLGIGEPGIQTKNTGENIIAEFKIVTLFIPATT